MTATTHSPGAVVSVYKPPGLTPFDCVKQYKMDHSILSTVSYAGRLDPMAEGVLLLLVGDENKNRRVYEHLDKEYEVDVLCGIGTDTGDLMGQITGVGGGTGAHQGSVDSDGSLISQEQLSRVLRSLVGRQDQRYPWYSSVKVRGKPLYWWARQGRIGEISIPTHPVMIQSVRLDSIRPIGVDEVVSRVLRYVPMVRGDFRQRSIVLRWRSLLQTLESELNLSVVRISVVCSSGTYMRVLAEDIGSRLGVPACALRIMRIRVGTYTLSNKVTAGLPPGYVKHDSNSISETLREG